MGGFPHSIRQWIGGRSRTSFGAELGLSGCAVIQSDGQSIQPFASPTADETWAEGLLQTVHRSRNVPLLSVALSLPWSSAPACLVFFSRTLPLRHWAAIQPMARGVRRRCHRSNHRCGTPRIQLKSSTDLKRPGLNHEVCRAGPSAQRSAGGLRHWCRRKGGMAAEIAEQPIASLSKEQPDATTHSMPPSAAGSR
jgi:hypothetical protein